MHINRSMFFVKTNGSSRMLLALLTTLLFFDNSFQDEITKCCRTLGSTLMCSGCSLSEFYFSTYNENIFTLDLHDNNIKELNKTSFENLPKLQDVDLSRNMIQAISEDTFSNLENLRTVNLNGNLIYNLTEIHLPSATKLDLGMNPLKLNKNYIGPSANKLMELDLTSCYLEDFFPKILENCPVVTKLILKSNQITKLDTEWFPTTSITYLDVSYNNIRTINERKQLPNLRELDLSFNNVESLTSKMFDFAPNLNILNLGGNDLKTLPNGPIFVHGAMESVILARCFIRRLQSDSLSKLPNVRTLDLNHNVLMDVENVFNSRSLEKLYLSDNFLTSLNPGTFSDLTSLQELYLDGNENLSELNSSAVDGLKALRLLDVSRTPLVCDCSAAYWSLRDWAGASGVTLGDACGEELPCADRPTTVATWGPDTKCFDAPEMCVGELCCLSGRCSVNFRCGAAALVALRTSMLVIIALIVLRFR